MPSNETMEFCRDWVSAARENPNRVGSVYPEHPPISFEMLNELVAAVDGKTFEPMPSFSFLNRELAEDGGSGHA